ncbi:MAG: AAA family ATPase [Actinobacteria bacterium]|nr:AAA family ATPase [Actinomycetota bacterium]
MDRIRNPFTPGAGVRPPLLVGRDTQLLDMSVAIQRMARGRFERSTLLTGLRGVGKTVLLNEFGRIAEQNGWRHEHLEVSDDTDIAKAIATLARRSLLEMSRTKRAAERAKRALGALRSFVKVHVPMSDGTTLTIDLDPRPGVADSGDLDVDLGGIFTELGETAADANTGLLYTIDELQYLDNHKFGALIVGLHRVSQIGLPLLVAGAGLPSLPGLAGEARSYAERLFAYSNVGSLDESDARRVLEESAASEGTRWHADALDELVARTEGYPYFLQEFGKQAWNVADGPEITRADVEIASTLAIEELDAGFFRARIDKTTNAERDYLRAMATLPGNPPYRSGDVAGALGKRTPQVGAVRDGLIKRGLLYAPRHGQLSFTVPMFEQFIHRSLT